MLVTFAGGRAAVVAREEEQCILAESLPVDRRDDLADGLVQRGEHAGVGPPRLGQVGVRRLVTLGHLVRGVDGVEGHVEEQRPRRVALVDQPDGLAGEQVGAVALVAADSGRRGASRTRRRGCG